VQSCLPAGLEIDTFDGSAWVGLTPFTVEASRPMFAPSLPRVSYFPETNLRTYVVGPDGRDGLWFLSIEADSASTTLAARTALQVPYHWADMSVTRHDHAVDYRSQRRGDARIGNHTTVRLGERIDVGDRRLADWLTGRWRAWIRPWNRLAVVAVQHRPWPLQAARVVSHHDTLLADSGLPTPSEPPLCIAAAHGVDAALGWPQLCQHQDRRP
jgi:uncharacterized protein YqjF (DUF2071 family)